MIQHPELVTRAILDLEHWKSTLNTDHLIIYERNPAVPTIKSPCSEALLRVVRGTNGGHGAQEETETLLNFPPRKSYPGKSQQMSLCDSQGPAFPGMSGQMMQGQEVLNIGPARLHGHRERRDLLPS